MVRVTYAEFLRGIAVSTGTVFRIEIGEVIRVTDLGIVDVEAPNLIVYTGMTPVIHPALGFIAGTVFIFDILLIDFLIVTQIIEFHQTRTGNGQVAEFILQLQTTVAHVIGRNRGIVVWRNVPVVRNGDTNAIIAAVVSIRDKETGTTLIANRQLHVRAVEHRHRTDMEAGIPDFSHFFLTILNHFGTDDAPAVIARQTGGKCTVIHDGVTVVVTLLHFVSLTTSLTADHLVVAILNISIFGGQVRKAFRAIQLDLVIVITHVAGRSSGSGRGRLIGIGDLIKLNLISIQCAVALNNVNVAAKQRTVRIIAGRLIGVDGHRQ
ncbi:hypothetical protein SRABI106_03642 [Rahnella aquatilis]|nr:hypothetical protein SRABI106_03642 [Rahnella aquatilis]